MLGYFVEALTVSSMLMAKYWYITLAAVAVFGLYYFGLIF